MSETELHRVAAPAPQHKLKICINQERDVETAENEDEDSGGDEHPAVRNRDNKSTLIICLKPCCTFQIKFKIRELAYSQMKKNFF
jgi:hypothetical protein